jgi:maleamate amidohydrolase
MKPWDGVIPEQEQQQYPSAGFGKRPALLIIDVQYRTVGTEPKPFHQAIKEFPTSCGEVGWGKYLRRRSVLQPPSSAAIHTKPA